MELGKKIKMLRTERKMTMQELADASDLSKGYISMLEKGRNPQTKKPIVPSLNTVSNISEALGLSIEQLLEGVNSDVELPEISVISQINKVTSQLTPPRQQKVYHYAEEQLDEQQLEEHSNIYMIHGRASAAGSAIEVDDNDARMNVVNSSTIPNGADEIVKITGDSMEPLIKKGSSVYIRHQPTIEQGEIAIVRIEDIGVTCKKVYKNNKEVRLKSINTTYDDMVFAADEIMILGKVLL